MKKFALTLAALAALSASAYASQRNNDLRDQDTYYGKYSTQAAQPGMTAMEGLMVVKKVVPATSYTDMRPSGSNSSTADKAY